MDQCSSGKIYQEVNLKERVFPRTSITEAVYGQQVPVLGDRADGEDSSLFPGNPGLWWQAAGKEAPRVWGTFKGRQRSLEVI